MKRQKIGTISEEDTSTILQRYTAATVLALLHEVAQVQDVKMDWNALVNKTRTGITNPREYQMLWRHLAYRHALLEKIEEDAKPLDDDSDLEYELEAFPAVSSEALTEATACVKVLIASGLPSDSGLEKGLTVEAPLIINIPNKSARIQPEGSQFATVRGTNITIPVSVQKQPLPTAPSTEPLDINGYGNGNVPARRKRKPWTPEEDEQLLIAVQKCGEGNWAIILKGEFKGDRTASQLAQRWGIIKKRNGNDVRTGSQLSEVHLTRQAIKMALDKPAIDNSKATSLPGRTISSSTPNSSEHLAVADTPSAGTLPQNQSHQNASVTGSQRLVTSGSFTRRTRPLSKAPAVNSLTNGPDPVKAAAVAAGARIATQSDAAAIFKAAQLKNAIHFKKPGDHLGSPLFSNRHSSIPPNASRPHLGPGLTSIGAVVQSNQSSNVPEMIVSSEINNGHEVKASANSAISPKAVQEDQVAALGNAQTENVVDASSNSTNQLKELVREDHTAVSADAQMKDIEDNQVAVVAHAAKDQEEQAPGSSKPGNENVRESEASIPDNALNEQVQEQKVTSPSLAGDLKAKMNGDVSTTNTETTGNVSVVMMGSSTNGDVHAVFPVEGGNDDQPVLVESCQDNNMKQKQDESQDRHVDGVVEKLDSVGNSTA